MSLYSDCTALITGIANNDALYFDQPITMQFCRGGQEHTILAVAVSPFNKLYVMDDYCVAENYKENWVLIDGGETYEEKVLLTALLPKLEAIHEKFGKVGFDQL